MAAGVHGAEEYPPSAAASTAVIEDIALSVSQDSAATDVKRLQKMQQKIKTTIRGLDSLEDDYIEPQHYDWSVMVQATRNFEDFILSSNGQSVMFSPDQRIKVGPYFGWRWVFLGTTFDLKNISLFGNSAKREIDFSIYSSQVGVDLFYRRTGKDYKLRQVRMGYGIDGSKFEDVPFDGISVGITGVNAYYIFNHGRFSYPAAFAQSTCQKVSCGSWMAGAGYTKNTLDLDFESLNETLSSRLPAGQEVKIDSSMAFNVKYSVFSLSLGYAYNWVFAKNWLCCASAQAALAYKTSYGKTTDEKKGFDISKVNIDGIGRFALVYNNTKWYAGLSAIFHTNNYHTSRFTANNIFGSINAYVGVNIKLKSKYKKNRT
jgi:hypothetical protein